ncbi:glycine/D-amino acid oxidase-like deaminating enzyme [Tamaricihabitans halophyticus]|uniref:Glycine/D-amino acid oxidase-like deaminating enzyme n=1 Tax=Tamaricihabitans halophyticus TaxID=1262583 RepID=A0A4R2R2W5_9PSEU|nr:FAD-dependent oxidoreductase [Tamaricihabitans halophyticus]TCP56154.1 glycine/D-amino acid oxidase-like deaminating enzyme [Tamaricihabitans halophyticus]
MADVVIIGGGSIGSATALQLLRAQPGIDVVVLEPDPSYTNAASTRATGGVRQLFTRPENILLSRYTLTVIEQWARFARASERAPAPPDLGWRPNGYLFIGEPATTPALERNFATQRELGVAAAWLAPDELAARYPYLYTDDLGPAILSERDGWLDPNAFLHGMRNAARGLGADYRTERAVEVTMKGAVATGVELGSGAWLPADAVVNAAGVAAPKFAAQAGMPVPVEPMPRFEHYVEVPGDFRTMPFIKDPAGLAVRPEGAGLSAGLVNFERAASSALPHEPEYFENVVWPALAHRIPTLDRLRLKSTWAGHYDQNRLDGNMIIGNQPGRVDNFYLATGFSGHGLMHAPGVGRALAELIVHGEYRTIDLARLGYQRVLDNAGYPELGVR